MGKFITGTIGLILVLVIMGAYPTVAVAVTAIVIVGMFLLFKE